jgi:hypothetical protein
MYAMKAAARRLVALPCRALMLAAAASDVCKLFVFISVLL